MADEANIRPNRACATGTNQVPDNWQSIGDLAKALVEKAKANG